MPRPRLAVFFLRVGLAGVFLYAAVAAAVQPDAWIGYLPGFLAASTYGKAILQSWGLFEGALALWLLSGRRPYEAGIVSALAMAAIIVPNIALLDIVFRDVAILFAGLALSALTHGTKKA
jgi:hypothetical protein